MTITDFLAYVKGYYGEYTPGVKDVVTGYLEEIYNEADIDTLWRHLVLTESTEYNRTPDVGVLERVRKAYNAEVYDKVGGVQMQIGKKKKIEEWLLPPKMIE